VLEPGDLLYLPPGVAHEGSAVGDGCITCSVGFRAPPYRELVDPWLDALAESAHGRAALRTLLTDPATRATPHPAQLPTPMIDAAQQRLQAVRPTRAHAVGALLAVLSEPKPNVTFAAPAHPLSPARWARAAATRGVRLDLRTRLLYRAGQVGINGEVLPIGRDERALLARLADQRALTPGQCRLSDSLCARLHEWYVDGWLHLA
jgi:50S ribosomal protein L16 3-hydroxylase